MIKNIKYLILLVLVIGKVFPIGLKALIIPQNAILIGSSSTGIAYHPELNPANHYNKNANFSFSNNTWFADVKGQKLSALIDSKKYFDYSFIAMESLSVTDIELRNEIANDEPLGLFGVYWYALELSQSVNLKKYLKNLGDINFGYKIKVNFSKLYSSTMYGYTLDIGINKKINNNITASFVVKNFGKEYSNDLSADHPIVYGIGAGYLIPSIYLNVLADIYYQNEEIISKFSLLSTFPYVNIFVGSTSSESYNDYSWGMKIELNKWAIIYGNLFHDNSSLNNPSAIELVKYF